MRPPPTGDEQSFEVYYNASRVRIVVNGLVDPATSFSISDVEICPEFCFDLEPSCTTTNLDFFTTMTLMSSSKTGMDITSTQLSIDQPVTTFVPSQVMPITSSFVEGIGVSYNIEIFKISVSHLKCYH